MNLEEGPDKDPNGRRFRGSRSARWPGRRIYGGRGGRRGAAFRRGPPRRPPRDATGFYEGEPIEGGGGRAGASATGRRREGERLLPLKRRYRRREFATTDEAPNYGGRRAIAAPITLDCISELSMLEPETLVKRVDSQLKDFQQAIGKGEIVRPESLNAVVVILSKIVCCASGMEGLEQSMASKVIAEVLSAERCAQFHFHLNQAVKSRECTVPQVEKFCNLFNCMLKRFESLAWDCLPVDELYETVKRLTEGGTIHSALFKKAQELFDTRDQIRKLHFERGPENDERDNSEFRLIPILPEWKEIKEDNGIPPEVRPNKVGTPYKDWMEYYDIQFRLIREDFIAPLRRGVAAFLRGERNRDVNNYSTAKIVAQVTTKKGICFTVQFDASGFNRVKYNWDHSKKLIFGSLLCFIPTHGQVNIDTVIFATVVDRDIFKLRRGQITVQFECDIAQTIAHHKNKTEFEIVESNSYYGAVSPILQSLKKAEIETMPFTRELIRGECDPIPQPVYLCVADDQAQVSYDMSCLYGSKREQNPPLHINILSKESWRAANDSELDSSQLNAIRTALTQEIAVIQGPPGTGKTYIGLKIVEGLLENRHIWDPHRSCPILVMCYTNHALDQFLEGIIDTECCGRELEVIRVGGRCKNEKVDAHNLNKIRKYYCMFSEEIGQLLGELDSCNPRRDLQKIIYHCKHTTFLPLHIIEHVANPYHFYQLKEMAQCEGHKGSVVEAWLEMWSETAFESRATDIQGSDVLPGSRKMNCDNSVQNESEKIHEGHAISQGLVQEKTIHSDAQDSQNPGLVEVESQAMIAQCERMDDDDVEGYQVLKQHDEKYSENDHDIKTENHPIQHQVNARSYANKPIARSFFKEFMDHHEAEEVEDIMELSTIDRWRLYNYWRDKRYRYLQEKYEEMVDKYVTKCKELTEVRQQEDRHILERADVVGMTTTGAAKYQHILHHIKPKIVIVEEAAEVLEAHIVSALSAGTQHLILIGDHKQLRPKPNEHVLATEYKLSISLFERLVMKNMSQATLEIQHRMRPEIARLVCPHVYETLLNHESVQTYPDIRGISNNLFFVCHTEPESENPNLLSYQNEFEAKYIVGLCAHLLKLGYSPSQITILTPYVGQLLLLQSKMPKKDFEGVRVTAIDNFQGEENDIILFSMVRSTNPKSGRKTIGFVKEDNRVCVSLSRAKHGFYAIGNFELIRHQSPLWESIISDVESRGCYGNALPLYCCNHPETKYSAVKESDFKANAPNGGCREMCDIRLPCGHSCTQTCHVVHDKYRCEKICEQTLKCGHTHIMPCYKFPKCPSQCSKVTCERGHKCKKTCHFPSQCGCCCEGVTINLPGCSHEQNLPCYMSENPRQHNYICNHPCEKKRSSCGHSCPRKCGELCERVCSVKIMLQPKCGHHVQINCGRKQSHTCTEKCPKTLDCGHACREICGKNCIKICEENVEKELPCGHKVTCECFRMMQSNFKCTHKSVCKYPCGHSSKIPCGSTIESHPCRKECTAKLSCGHRCSGKCGDCYSSRMHTVCIFKIRLRRYCGHSVTLPCASLSDSCDHKTHQVPCSHREDHSKCHEPCTWDCKHFQCERECGEECERPPCNEPCDKELSCGHRCPGLCGERCMSVCLQCAPKKFVYQFHPKPKQGHKLPRKGVFFELCCGHIFTVRDLDEYMRSQAPTVKPRQCPKCHQYMDVGNRYGNAVKKATADVEHVNNLIIQYSFVPESEREELRHACLRLEQVVDGLLGRFNEKWFLTTVKKKLDSDHPVTAEESCLVRCVDSFYTLYTSLQSCPVGLLDHVCRDLKAVVKSLLVSLCLQHGLFELDLSWQVLEDFMSEMYRLALSAQCTVTRNQASEDSQSTAGPELAVVAVEEYMQSLNPLRDRISETRYLQKLSSAVSGVADIHVVTPRVPTVVKGTWMKCPAGHFYCVPPVCGAGARSDSSCPKCQ